MPHPSNCDYDEETGEWTPISRYDAPADIWGFTPKQHRSCAYFHDTSTDAHTNVLSHCPTGGHLLEFSKRKKIMMIRNEEMTGNDVARYIHVFGNYKPGHIEYGEFMHAVILGHELRHVEQHLSPVMRQVMPTSPEEHILLSRFIEADARAVEFGIAMQIIGDMGHKNDYGQNLLACLDRYQKQICRFSFSEVDRLGHEPLRLKHAMRTAFDCWMAFSPSQTLYEDLTRDAIKMTRAGRIERAFATLVNRGTDPIPRYTRRGISPEFLQTVTEAFGQLGGGTLPGNYLTETKGLPFDNPFYTRINNYKLERLADRLCKP